jgi:hypothetical protein
MRLSSIAAACLALVLLCGDPRAAHAGCFELVGCPNRDPFAEFDLSLLSCKRLNFIRNSIFAEKGYCFQQTRYRRMFGRYECRYETAADVPLNTLERDNIQKILHAEAEKGCPKLP